MTPIADSASLAIARCRAEQLACAAHIIAGLPGQAGALLGLSDWVMEEILIGEADVPNPAR